MGIQEKVTLTQLLAHADVHSALFRVAGLLQLLLLALGASVLFHYAPPPPGARKRAAAEEDNLLAADAA